MPTLYSGHSGWVTVNGAPVAPGESYFFSDDEAAAGIAGQWTAKPPKPKATKTAASVPDPEITPETPAEPGKED